MVVWGLKGLGVFGSNDALAATTSATPVSASRPSMVMPMR